MLRSIEARIQKLEIARQPFTLQTDLSHLTDRQLLDITCEHALEASGIRPYLSRPTTTADRDEWAKGPNKVKDWGFVIARLETNNVPAGCNAVSLRCGHSCGLGGFLFDVSATSLADLETLEGLWIENHDCVSAGHKRFDFLAYELIQRGELDFVLYEEGKEYQENYTDGLRLF